MPRVLRAAVLLFASFLVPSCAAVDALNATVGTDGLIVVRDLPFGSEERQHLDVYRPTDRAGPLPVMVFLYGGSWQTGRRQDYLFVAAALARQGMLVVVPDYRLYPQVQFPDFIDDAASAVAYARRAAASWGGDPRRVFVVGHSAGAYLALMLALDPHYLATAGEDNRALAGVVGISGPYDFLPIKEADIQAVFASAPDLRVTQPINHVDGHNPPILLLHGEADRTVFVRNTIALAARIRAAGGMVMVKTYSDVGHVGIVLGFSELFRNRSPVLADVSAFIQSTRAPVSVWTPPG